MPMENDAFALQNMGRPDDAALLKLARWIFEAKGA